MVPSNAAAGLGGRSWLLRSLKWHLQTLYYTYNVKSNLLYNNNLNLHKSLGEPKVQHVDNPVLSSLANGKVVGLDVTTQPSHVMESLNSFQSLLTNLQRRAQRESFSRHSTSQSTQIRSDQLHDRILVVFGSIGSDQGGKAKLDSKLGQHEHIQLQDRS